VGAHASSHIKNANQHSGDRCETTVKRFIVPGEQCSHKPAEDRAGKTGDQHRHTEESISFKYLAGNVVESRRSGNKWPQQAKENEERNSSHHGADQGALDGDSAHGFRCFKRGYHRRAACFERGIESWKRLRSGYYAAGSEFAPFSGHEVI